MSQVIRIPDSTFKRLQEHAVAFVDSPADVIARLLDEHEGKMSNNKDNQSASSYNSAIELDPLNPEDLSHTRVLQLKVDGKTERPKWNSMVVTIHRIALKKLSSFDKVRQFTLSNVVEGEKSDSGFRFIDGAGFSIQYVDSNHAWQHTLHLAKELNVEVEVIFEWRQKTAAANPGQKGHLHFHPIT